MKLFLALAISIGLFLLALTVSCWSGRTAMGEGCCQPEGTVCVWIPGTDPSTVVADSNGSFTYDIDWQWCLTEENPPEWADFTFLPAVSDNIEEESPEVSYSPSYFQIFSCSGSRIITVEGELDENDEEGTLVTQGRVFVPLCSKNKSVVIQPAS
jgi:hypothetical protein